MLHCFYITIVFFDNGEWSITCGKSFFMDRVSDLIVGGGPRGEEFGVAKKIVRGGIFLVQNLGFIQV